MARTVARLPEGTRVSDYITLGVVAKAIPARTIHEVLRKEGRGSSRRRQLPAHVVVYYVIALALFMGVSYGEVLRCLVEGLAWLGQSVERIRRTSRSAISQARSRLGFEPMQRLYEEIVHPVATEATHGAWYCSPVRGRKDSPRQRWRLVSLDGSTLDVPDEAANREAFGLPGSARGRAAFPKIRFVSMVECGTHVLFGAVDGPYGVGEIALAQQAIAHLRPGMLCIADRGFFSYALWQQAAATGADLLWRVKADTVLPRFKEFEDGSYLSRIYRSPQDRRHDRNGCDVRVIEYVIEDEAGQVTTPENADRYRLITTIVEPALAPARDLAKIYHERWEIENAFDEFKTHLRRGAVLRSKKPDLVRQEFYGLLLAHYAVRGLMHEAALKADIDSDDVSFVHSVRVIRRKIQSIQLPPGTAPFPPSGNFDAP